MKDRLDQINQEKCPRKMNRFQILDWDSEFFGITIARILPERLTTDELQQTIADIRNDRVRLAYWASDPMDEESQQAARACNGYLADKKVTFVAVVQQDHESEKGSNWVIEEYTDTSPCFELENLAIQAGIYSRFKLDSRIPDNKFVDLYKLWVLKSVNRQIADRVFVGREGYKIVGMITVGVKNGRSDIGLTAVDASMRGNNLGTSLVCAAKTWAYRNGFRFAQVVTQADNIAACKLYEKCGFTIDKTEFLYHFWM